VIGFTNSAATPFGLGESTYIETHIDAQNTTHNQSDPER
jgi:hypothetical protein